MLGNSEDNTALSRALSQLAEVEDKVEQLHQEQAASDFFIFEELLADYIRLLGAVRVGVSCMVENQALDQRQSVKPGDKPEDRHFKMCPQCEGAVMYSIIPES